MSRLSNLWNRVVSVLFPVLDDAPGPLTEKLRQFVAVCELAKLERHIAPAPCP